MRSLRILGLAVLGWTMLSVIPGHAQTNQPPLKLTAFAINMANVATGANAQVDINITRWSTEAERQKLITTFTEKGPAKLLDALQDQKPVGYFKLPNRLGYDLRFARQRPEPEGGRMIFLMTDRYIGAWEAANRPRTIDYPFTLIQLQLDKDGNGVGKASVYTKITEEVDGTIALEDFADQPVMLNSVRKVQ